MKQGNRASRERRRGAISRIHLEQRDGSVMTIELRDPGSAREIREDFRPLQGRGREFMQFARDKFDRRAAESNRESNTVTALPGIEPALVDEDFNPWTMWDMEPPGDGGPGQDEWAISF
jgi:hypothetical protein